ncbi:hypothetical protein ANCCAN_10036 [Ancylostoma caninum]|uniref:Acyltransferase 3 domain-containing protein n=1 Tax=Ancylostoma caninum TaxID=29170 RepID=A0A368GL79_ANCCA|nr:hypothetical protein ANCCAN_10036 [Ancylostoma caninum]
MWITVYKEFAFGALLVAAFGLLPWEIVPLRLQTAIISTFLVVAGHFFMVQIICNEVMIYIGNISYPLYLAHWPIFVLMRYHQWHLPQAALFGLIISVIMAIIVYHYISAPLHEANVRKTVYALALTIFLMKCATPNIPEFGEDLLGSSRENHTMEIENLNFKDSVTEEELHRSMMFLLAPEQNHAEEFAAKRLTLPYGLISAMVNAISDKENEIHINFSSCLFVRVTMEYQIYSLLAMLSHATKQISSILLLRVSLANSTCSASKVR